MKTIKITESQFDVLSKRLLKEDIKPQTQEIIDGLNNKLKNLKIQFNTFWKEKDINYNEFSEIEKGLLDLEKEFDIQKREILNSVSSNEEYYADLESSSELENLIQNLDNKIHDFSIIVDKAVSGLKQFIGFPFQINVD